jgi:hypothetical protein
MSKKITKTKNLLIIDAFVNFVLGVLLLLSIPLAEEITHLLGVPTIDNAFYSSIMGGVFLGIGFALVIEWKRTSLDKNIGLGLNGAAAINLCGALVLSGWLIFRPDIFELRGKIILWFIVCTLGLISFFEIVVSKK